jgi:NTP pyrophosphatase (non-canonical NTP hydrolase)
MSRKSPGEGLAANTAIYYLASECPCMDRSLESLQDRYAAFVTARGWDQYHTPQNLAAAISIEANELLENFLWFNNPDVDRVADDAALMADIEDELADVVIYVLALANQLNIDILAAVEQKIDENEQRFDEERVAELAADLEKWQ